ncbi:hypothetical protein PENTCL1PPCAC_14420, partial [Pristionchus entomophagus]
MPHKRTLRLKKRFGDCRQCLVCGGKTISSHLGMNVCRACSVFYKRSLANPTVTYECRSTTGSCQINKGASCRKCRFTRIQSLLEQTELPVEVNVFSKNSLFSDDIGSGHSNISSNRYTSIIPSALVAMPLSVVTSVQSAYRTRSQIRLTCELISRRSQIPHPMHFFERDVQFVQATYGSMNEATRILISSIVGFGRSAFPEFADLLREDQWTIAVNFFYRFSVFEYSFRAHQHFPQKPDRIFAGYTIWTTPHYDERFFSDCPNLVRDIDHAKTSMGKRCEGNHRKFRSIMERQQLTEQEFLYMVAIMFWTTDNLKVTNSATAMSERYRTAIMQELHVYFRKVKLLDDYAARLGELLTTIQIFDRCDEMKENYEFLRLIEVYSDDTFVY